MWHVVVVIISQALCFAATGEVLLAGVVVSAFYIGREHSQAEYRVLKEFYGNKRANAPWYCGFELRAWTLKGVLDWIAPLVASSFVALIHFKFF